MFGRLSPAIRAAASVSRNSVRNGSGYPAHWKSPSDLAKYTRSTLNDLPVPQGSWSEANAKKNMKYNMQLAASAVLLVVTYIAMEKTGVTLYHDVKDYKKLNIDPSKPLEKLN